MGLGGSYILLSDSARPRSDRVGAARQSIVASTEYPARDCTFARMGRDFNNSSLPHRTVSWAQFLREQSIYILAARRNAANLYKIAPKPEELEIIEAETNYERLLEPSSEGG